MDQGAIHDKYAIQDHIYSFYKEFMGMEDPKFISLS
jgi:hypothetical protein